MKYCEHKQHGVALLLALGVLSLLLATGIAFVSNTLLAQKSAAAYRFRAQSQLLGRSAIQRVMMLMRYYLETGSGLQIGQLKSTLNKETFKESADIPHSNTDQTTTLDGGKNDFLNVRKDSLLTATVDGTERQADGTEQWEYLWDKYSETGKRDADAKLIGRFAYRVLSTGSVNFSEILRGNPNLSPTNTKSTWIKRRGFGIRELNLNMTGAAYWLPAQLDVLDDRFASEASIKDNFQEQDSTRSNDYSTFQSMFDGRDALTLAMRNVIRRFLPPGGTEEEVYMHVTGTYDKSKFNPADAKSHTKYHRFNLCRTDWDKLGAEGSEVIKNSDKLVLRLLGESVEPAELKSTDSVNNDTEKTADCIPALRRIGNTAGAYPTLTARRKQIAANLIDYCDTDSIPTSDGTDWNATSEEKTKWPTYTGNEKTPYINEILITPSVAVRQVRTTTGNVFNRTYTYDLTTKVDLQCVAVELINLFENKFTSPTVRISGSMKLSIAPTHDGQSSLEAKEVELKFDNTAAASPEQTWLQASGTGTDNYRYSTLYSGNQPTKMTVTALNLPSWSFEKKGTLNFLSKPLTVTVTVTEFKIDKVCLKTDSEQNNTDFVRDLIFTPTKTFSQKSGLLDFDVDSDETVTVYPHLGCEVDDPRENLYQGPESAPNWTLLESADQKDKNGADLSDTTTPDLVKDFTFGAINTACKPGNDGSDPAKMMDVEKDVTDPCKISTACIRNEPMQSLAELGIIHRAEKWQTLNLRASKRTLTDTPLAGLETAGDTYAEGDAGILDQVKMTSKVLVPHRLYINDPPGADTPESKLLYAGLFRGLKWKWSTHYKYDENEAEALASPETAGDVLAGRDAAANSGALKFFSRAELINTAIGDKKLFNAYGQVTPTTDAQMETIPALISGLISFYPRPPDPVVMILAAQSIRDIGTSAGFKMKKINPDGSESSEKEVKSGVFDFDGTTYFDEITGTARFYVEIGTDGTSKKVKPLRIEPLD